MSIILEALKKSEKERNKNALPGIDTEQEWKLPEATKSYSRPFPLLIVSMAVFLTAIVFLLIHNNIIKSGGSQVLNHTPNNPHPPEKQSETLHSPTEKISLKEDPAPITAAVSQAQGRSKSQTALPDMTPPLQTMKSPEHPLSPVIKSVQDEIPDSIKSDVSVMSITTLVYSPDPLSRMAGINGKVYREGQFVLEGLKLEAITRDELVFSFNGHPLKKKIY